VGQLQRIIQLKSAGSDVLSAFKEIYGYRPRVDASKVPSAGWGVFLEGCATAGSTVAVYPGLIIRDLRSVDELTYGVVSSPPAVHYIASMPDTHASTIRCAQILRAAIVMLLCYGFNFMIMNDPCEKNAIMPAVAVAAILALISTSHPVHQRLPLVPARSLSPSRISKI
jgi:hypothetical protein